MVLIWSKKFRRNSKQKLITIKNISLQGIFRQYRINETNNVEDLQEKESKFITIRH